MLELSRSVRFCLHPGVPLDQRRAGDRLNTFAAWPTMSGVGVYYEMVVRCSRRPDPVSGFIMDIGSIDRSVREHALPLVAAALGQGAGSDPAGILREIVTRLQPPLERSVRSVTWRLTPYYWLTLEVSDM
ncbi:MAG: hypothetical protein ACYTGC_16800, partial [Planctomycetota bacterium]